MALRFGDAGLTVLDAFDASVDRLRSLLRLDLRRNQLREALPDALGRLSALKQSAGSVAEEDRTGWLRNVIL